MPMFQFDCSNPFCRSRHEELYGGHWGKSPLWMTCARCGGIARKRTAYIVRVVGPVFEHMEAYNKMLLSPAQRASGMELKTGKEIEQYEQAKGLRRHNPNSTEYRQVRESELDDLSTMQRVAREDGRDAAIDYVDRSNITEATGWSSLQYDKWKGATDDAEHQLAADPGKFAKQLGTTLCDAGGTGELARDADS